jgi:2,4-dienoyl-CoA reductase-like NADH-dependent reductase (Old Yellow Enzyme family)
MIAFRKLFRPFNTGNLELKNRIVMAPVGADLAAPDSSVSEALIRYHQAGTRVSCALNTVEVAMIEPLGTAMSNSLMISDDKYIPGWRALADAVHKAGCKVFCDTRSRAKLPKPLPTAGSLREPSE